MDSAPRFRRFRSVSARLLSFDLFAALPIAILVSFTALGFITLGTSVAGVAGAGDRVYDRPEDVRPLSPGQRIPKAVVRSVLGKPVDLVTAIGEGGALLVFYRGGW